MKVPTLEGLIRRRMLINFRVDPQVMQRQLPERLRPKLHNGYAVAGICLIRLEQIRPQGLPELVGVSSENGAHRIAVTWVENGVEREGVYIPRRDTSSLLNHVAGGRVFPGELHLSDFEVRDDGAHVDLRMKARDDGLMVHVEAQAAETLPRTSLFASIEQASKFFEGGAVGYSVTHDENRLDGIKLMTNSWAIKPLEVLKVESSFFSDTSRFPPGTVTFDCGLIMRDVPHQWLAEPDLKV